MPPFKCHSYEDVVRLNNQGVSLLAGGRNDPREAIESFRRALALVNLTDPKAEENNNHTKDEVNDTTGHNILADTAEIKDCLESVVLPSFQNQEDDGCFFVYRRAFRISRSEDLEATTAMSSTASTGTTTDSNTSRKRRRSNSMPPSLPDDGNYRPLPLDILSSTLVFNMAISHTVLGELLQEKRAGVCLETRIDTLNDTSRRLYLMSLGLLGGIVNSDVISAWTMDSWALLTASANNSSKILFDQGEVEIARSMMKILWQTIIRICRDMASYPQALLDILEERRRGGHRSGERTSRGEQALPPTESTANDSNIDSTPAITSSDPSSSEEGTVTRRRESTYFNGAEMEGFIMNVMLMDQIQMPSTAKAA
jgi:hypothetical protein